MQEILALPQWERECWRAVFAQFGPLDWRRDDLLFARVNQFQAVGDDPLREFILFKEPDDRETVEDREEALLRELGYYDQKGGE